MCVDTNEFWRFSLSSFLPALADQWPHHIKKANSNYSSNPTCTIFLTNDTKLQKLFFFQSFGNIHQSALLNLQVLIKFYCRIFKYQTESKFLGPIRLLLQFYPIPASMNSWTQLAFIVAHCIDQWPFISGKISIEPGFKKPALSTDLVKYSRVFCSAHDTH